MHIFTSVGIILNVIIIIIIISSPPVGVRSIATSVSVCLSVCLSVCTSARVSQKPPVRISRNFCSCYLWSWLGILLTTMQCYVLPVLWMTSRFHVIKPIMGRHCRQHCFVEFDRWLQQLDVRPYLIEFARWRHRG